jgi:hypothetical protein
MSPRVRLGRLERFRRNHLCRGTNIYHRRATRGNDNQLRPIAGIPPATQPGHIEAQRLLRLAQGRVVALRTLARQSCAPIPASSVGRSVRSASNSSSTYSACPQPSLVIPEMLIRVAILVFTPGHADDWRHCRIFGCGHRADHLSTSSAAAISAAATSRACCGVTGSSGCIWLTVM